MKRLLGVHTSVFIAKLKRTGNPPVVIQLVRLVVVDAKMCTDNLAD